MSLNSPFWKILLRVMVLEDPSLIFQCALKRAVNKAHGLYLTEYYVESVDTVTRRLLKETKNNRFWSSTHIKFSLQKNSQGS